MFLSNKNKLDFLFLCLFENKNLDSVKNQDFCMYMFLVLGLDQTNF